MGMGASGCILGRAASLLASSSGPYGENEFTPQFMAIFIGKIWENDDSAVDFGGSLFSDEPIVSHSWFPPIEVLLLRWPWNVLEFGPRLLLGSCLKQTRLLAVGLQVGVATWTTWTRCRSWRPQSAPDFDDLGRFGQILTDLDRFFFDIFRWIPDWLGELDSFCFLFFSKAGNFPSFSDFLTDPTEAQMQMAQMQALAAFNKEDGGLGPGALLEDPGAAFDKRGYVISKLPPTKFKHI